MAWSCGVQFVAGAPAERASYGRREITVLRRILDGLALIGRYGTQGFIVSLVAGLALPQLAAAAKPFLGVAIFSFVMMTFMRVDAAALKGLIARPARLALSCACLIVVPVLVVGATVSIVGRDALNPGLLLGLAILAASPPMMSAPAVAMLLQVEPTLILASVLSVTIVSPLISPFVAGLVAVTAVPFDILLLAHRLVWLVGGAIVAAIMLRRLIGISRIRRRKASFDGLSVVMYFVFAVAAMDGVLAAILGDPARVARFLGMAVGVSLVCFATTWFVLRRVPAAQRLVLGYAAGQRNMGLLVAALGAHTPDTTFLFFALAQFPIYLGPQIIKPIARRLAFTSEATVQRETLTENS